MGNSGGAGQGGACQFRVAPGFACLNGNRVDGRAAANECKILILNG